MERYNREDLIEIINKLSKRVEDLNREVKAYENRKDELETKLLKRDKKIELYLKIINRYRSSSNLGTRIDVSNEYRISKLEDKVGELEDGLKGYTKILLSTRNTLQEFLKRIYK